MGIENVTRPWALHATLSVMLALCIAAPVCAADSSAAVKARLEPLGDFPQTTVTIFTPDARRHTFNAWVAATDARREQGLMFVKMLDPNTGMLFTFDEPQPINMWMKNTLIPLDMVFIDSQGSIESIVVNATPQSLQIISSKGAVQAVLELKGGITAQLGIRAGALVRLER